MSELSTSRAGHSRRFHSASVPRAPSIHQRWKKHDNNGGVDDRAMHHWRISRIWPTYTKNAWHFIMQLSKTNQSNNQPTNQSINMKTAIAIAASLSLSTVVTNASVARSLLGVNSLAAADQATSCTTDQDCEKRNHDPDCDGGNCECKEDEECVSGKCSPYPIMAVDELTILSWSDSDADASKHTKRCEPAMAPARCMSAADCISRHCFDGKCRRTGPDSPTYLTPCLTNADCPAPEDQTCADFVCKANAAEQCGLEAGAVDKTAPCTLPGVVPANLATANPCPSSYICTEEIDATGNYVQDGAGNNVVACKKHIVMHWESASRLYQRAKVGVSLPLLGFQKRRMWPV